MPAVTLMPPERILSRGAERKDPEEALETLAGAGSGGGDGAARMPAEPGSPTVQGEPLWALMGRSEAVRRIEREILQVAHTGLSVVVAGETGSGKELVARAIHETSPRSKRPFIAVDCGSLPENLIESELFGHEKGAFTGAVAKRLGKLSLATGGTLFLDEISNFPPSLQAKLLRALQERRFYPVGGVQPIDVDLRIVAATNVPLQLKVDAGNFRLDLYHRLSEFEIRVPPLRERRGDILYLAERFLSATNRELRRNVRGLSKESSHALLEHSWPGNVRELRNVVRRAVLLATGEVIRREDLSIPERALPAAASPPVKEDRPLDGSRSLWDMVGERVAELERGLLLKALRQTGGNKAEAARLLKIDYKTMHNKTKAYGYCLSEVVE
ncbi:MAG: sigma-54-dependent Fis family transcriptional regulator [Planctomycetes bacterium]|nr:sigma-54-dependent Fis family transcriptional regulator [Planctomycetota bacterium]